MSSYTRLSGKVLCGKNTICADRQALAMVGCATSRPRISDKGSVEVGALPDKPLLRPSRAAAGAGAER